MSSIPASLTSDPTFASAAAAEGKVLRPPISIALAMGLVLGPVLFFLLIAGFLHVARKGDVFPQPPTAALRDEAVTRRRDLAKFMARSTDTRSTPAGGSRGVPPPLPLYTPPALPPPVYTPASSVLPAYDLATGGTVQTSERRTYAPAPPLPSTQQQHCMR